MSFFKPFGDEASFRGGGEVMRLRFAGDGGFETGLDTARPRFRLGPASV
jgi:hypothetical protein